jgi:sterol desaturase/sphingolipid hydroxylase (fatty acid hydroxylase superfamily)
LDLTNFIKLPIAILLTEVIFYYVHYAFHKVPFLIKFHALHHEITGPFTLATFYCHPVEMLAGNLAPFIVAGKLSGLNFQTMRLWHFIAVFNTMISAHGGYQVFNSTHDQHHKTKTHTYGLIGLMDYIHHTKHRNLIKKLTKNKKGAEFTPRGTMSVQGGLKASQDAHRQLLPSRACPQPSQ